MDVECTTMPAGQNATNARHQGNMVRLINLSSYVPLVLLLSIAIDYKVYLPFLMSVNNADYLSFTGAAI